jgi:predicted dehydrogenase
MPSGRRHPQRGSFLAALSSRLSVTYTSEDSRMQNEHPDLNRRDFVRAGSVAAFIAALGGVPITAETAAQAQAPATEEKVLPAPKADPNLAEKPPGPPVRFGIIGIGTQGREIIAHLNKLPNAPVVALCDTYKAAFKRGAEGAPKATQYADAKELLADPQVQAVVIATPTHQHRDLALAALSAGKHVYLEAPIAHTLADARAIAAAAKALPLGNKQIFQVGLQLRENPQNHHVARFIRAGATGRSALSRGQWNKKISWRRTSPNPEREQALNWRLYRATSLGIPGEIAIHSLDVARWYFDKLPVAVSGFGGIVQWQDDREMADSVSLVVEFQSGLRHTWTGTLANSFEGEHDVFFGSDAAVLMRDNKAWMFKESDAPLLGWEVYARKDEFLGDSGIALVANATKILAQGKKPAEVASESEAPLKYALERFVGHINDATKPEADWLAGYQSTVLAIKAAEAVAKGGRIEISPDLWQV